jgi:hypothetical protein
MLDVSLLYQYLFQFHRLSMEGLGEIMLVRKAATLRMLDKQIDPPVYHIEFSHQCTENSHFVNWISERLSISCNDAESILKNYTQYLLLRLQDSGRVQWKNLGEWLQDQAGNIYFQGQQITLPGQISLTAEKLMRGNADHKVLIGDETYSGERLHALLEKNKKKLTQSHSTLLIAGSIIVAAILVLYCLVGIPGFTISHQMHSKLNAKKNQETYTIINAE